MNTKKYNDEELKERRKQQQTTPERRQYQREYYANTNPEAKQRLSDKRMQYRNDPETKQRLSKKKRQYNAKPEVKERAKEYNAKPEVKERAKEYKKKYNANPEVKERTVQRNKERNKKKRQEYIKSEKYLIYIKAKEESLISKKCSICNVVKLKSFFTTSGASKQTGSMSYKPYCKECSKTVWEIQKKDSDYLNKSHQRQKDWRKRTYDKSKEKRKMDARIERFGGIDEWRKAANLKHRERRLLKRDAFVLKNAGAH
jgi:hypothetical protein